MEQKLREVGQRICTLREIMNITPEEMAKKVKVSVEEYLRHESGEMDFNFTFIYKCAKTFGVDPTDIINGTSPTLSSYTVTHEGEGLPITRRAGFKYLNLAPMFKNKIAEPFKVTIPYSAEAEDKPIHLSTHYGQEFDIVISGSMKIQVGNNVEVLNAGDTIYYDSSTPHGMIAVGGESAEIYAVVLNKAEGEVIPEEEDRFEQIIEQKKAEFGDSAIWNRYIDTTLDEKGVLNSISFKDPENFNFAFDCIDELAKKCPDKVAMIHIANDMTERKLTYSDLSRYSSKTANYFESLGIKKGDRVMLVLKRHYQFWFSMVALHKLGAVAVPATHQLKDHDFVYRFDAANVKAIVCTADDGTAEIAEAAAKKCPSVKKLVLVGGKREGWHDFDSEYGMYSSNFERSEETPSGDEPALMFFSSGTTGNPKMVEHKHTYALGHFVTAKYWHCCERDGLHFTISDTGWGKSLWGKLYGQWLCEGAVFVYDFDRFSANDILPMFAKYNITTFCAPPTMLRMFIKEDLSKYDLSSIHHMTTAGEALNPEVYKQFEKATGLQIMEGFGQTETTLAIANLYGTTPKIGAMGKASPQYDIVIVDPDGKPVADGEVGEICIRLDNGTPVGLFRQYLDDEEKMEECMRNGMYHTGDTAWRDEDGYFWYVSRIDDVIKSSGYRIGPFEIESVIMELPYVLECGVSAAPDELRGQIVKASIVLTKGTEPTEELKKEIQNYVKEHTAPYKYPRLVVFRDELPKTISGKIQRNKL